MFENILKWDKFNVISKKRNNAVIFNVGSIIKIE